MRSIQEWMQYFRRQQEEDKPEEGKRPPVKRAEAARPARQEPERLDKRKCKLPKDAAEVSGGGPPPVPVEVADSESGVRPVGARQQPPPEKKQEPAAEPRRPVERRTKAERSEAGKELVAQAGLLQRERERLRHLLAATQEALQVQLPMQELPSRTPAQKRRQQDTEKSRRELLARLANPQLTLEETALLLGVAPETVRRYADKGLLKHHRTPGNQRRFRLEDLLEFLRRAKAEEG